MDVRRGRRRGRGRGSCECGCGCGWRKGGLGIAGQAAVEGFFDFAKLLESDAQAVGFLGAFIDLVGEVLDLGLQCLVVLLGVFDVCGSQQGSHFEPGS